MSRTLQKAISALWPRVRATIKAIWVFFRLSAAFSVLLFVLQDFTHEDARKRAYRWGEDGIAGVCDSHGWLNIAFSFWNGISEILKERLFGISSEEGNHGQSIKEAHFHIDNLPTHSYMKYLYKYPQKEFPYRKILENSRRSKDEREYSLLDTGVFENDAYWDIFIEVAKGDDDPEDLHFRIVAWNRGSEREPLHIIPQAWFRNTWAWGHELDSLGEKPSVKLIGQDSVHFRHKSLGELFLNHSPSPGTGESGDDVLPKMLFTENETNLDALGLGTNKTPCVKDGFHKHIVNKDADAINPNQIGTKCASWYAFDEDGGVKPGECAVVRFKLMREALTYLDEELFDDLIEKRSQEADEFYFRLSPLLMSDDVRNIQRQAFAGLLWSKQYYHFNWEQWAKGDPTSPPFMRKNVHNKQGKQIHWDHVLSVKDSWEYPFTNPWDSAFDCVVMAMLDPDFARYQLDLLTRENYMQPSGQIPSNDCNFDEVDPPVLAWAAFRVFKIERKMYGRQDLEFLENVFQKILLNFTWWVNRKDTEGKNIFEGGFLGLDNIGPFDRSAPLPTGGNAVLQQADSTAWMAVYCLSMLNIALELAKYRRNYERLAAKFFEHFILISDAMGDLWNTEDGFYYDAISWGGGRTRQLRVRSLVGLIPLLATLTLEPEMTNKVSWLKKRLDWFIESRSHLAERNIASIAKRGQGNRLLLALASKDRLERILKRFLDEEEFFADHGIRSLSKYHKEDPYCVTSNGKKFEVGYQPAQSDGNTNWRGPIWMTVNFLLIESLQRFYLFYGTSLQVECPTGSGDYMHLGHITEELQHRLQHLFTRSDDGRRSINAGNDTRDFDPSWKDFLSFYEFFNGDTGRGLGANHHCGSSSLIARIIHDTGANCRLPQTPRTAGVGMQHYFDEVFGKPKYRHPRLSSTRAFRDRDFAEEEEDEKKAVEADSSKKAEADALMAKYVSEQLEKVKIVVRLNDWAEPMHKPTQELEPIEHHHSHRELDPARREPGPSQAANTRQTSKPGLITTTTVSRRLRTESSHLPRRYWFPYTVFPMSDVDNPLDWDEIDDIGHPDPEYAEFGFHDFAKEWKDRILPWYSFRDSTGQGGRISDIASFLRTWLFFGLLKEVLGEDLGSVQYLKTKGRIDKGKVVRQIEEWRRREVETPAGRTSRLARVQLVLTEARSLVTEICSVDNVVDTHIDPLNKDIPLSLMVLGEMLTGFTTRLLLELKEVRIRGWHIDGNRGWGQTSAILKTMKERWNPDTVRMLNGSLGGHATSQLYALHLTPGPNSPQASPQGWDVSGKGYNQAHSDTCDLHDNEDLIGPDQDKLAEVIERGKILLVKYCSSSGKMEILEFEPATRFAIISHVWADGYGNPNENKIHKCVLEFFNNLFLDTQNLLNRKDPDPELPFWIDTLTIPVNNPVQRKRAIMTMHHAYTNADFMVIIDSALEKMEVGKSYSETAMKIFTSRWIGRLWTLQEAYLSKLIFRFNKNELVDMDQLESNFFTSHTLADSMVAGKARKYFDRLLGWQRQKRIYGVPIYDSVLLASIWEAVQ
ncbi:Glyco-hydro-63 domain-containing protein [Fusarium sp. LHS14.1]|nr:Glyco-hydro-63 domain-containing protein [Fusarium sp. LHS14.1]